MDLLTLPKPFSDAARSAFAISELGDSATKELASFVVDKYRTDSKHLISGGIDIYIPYRLQFLPNVNGEIMNFVAPSRCLLTRSTDGYLRQRALKSILALNDEWVIPFVVLLLGEYVVEIVEDIRASMRYFDDAAYARFARQNQWAMRKTRARATSYWNVYYRQRFSDLRLYPAVVVLDQLDAWAN